jgi:hypothetical protein
MYETTEDRRREADFLADIASAWRCQIRRYAGVAPVIDAYGYREDETLFDLEVKVRSFESTRFADVLIPVRKLHALRMSELESGRPAYYAIRFTDRDVMIPARAIDASRSRIWHATNSAADEARGVEPVVMVAVADMRPIRRAT